ISTSPGLLLTPTIHITQTLTAQRRGFHTLLCKQQLAEGSSRAAVGSRPTRCSQKPIPCAPPQVWARAHRSANCAVPGTRVRRMQISPSLSWNDSSITSLAARQNVPAAKVLIVDRDPDVVERLRSVVVAAGYPTVGATTATQA